MPSGQSRDKHGLLVGLLCLLVEPGSILLDFSGLVLMLMRFFVVAKRLHLVVDPNYLSHISESF